MTEFQHILVAPTEEQLLEEFSRSALHDRVRCSCRGCDVTVYAANHVYGIASAVAKEDGQGELYVICTECSKTQHAELEERGDVPVTDLLVSSREAREALRKARAETN